MAGSAAATRSPRPIAEVDEVADIGLLEDEAIELDSAALRLAALDHPDVDLDSYLDLLGGITDALGEAGGNARQPVERAEALAAVLGERYGFTGDRTSYDDPDNADLIRVIDRRRGLPVSLSILYVASARRLGWPAEVLNTPGHVLIRVGPETEPLLLDPFNDGAKVGPEALARLLSGVLGGRVEPSSEHLAPMTNRAVLVRLLLNQSTRAETAGRPARALTLFERITAIAPDNAHGWWERARLQLVHRDVAGARSSLSAMLEVTREPGVRAHVLAALDALSGAGG